MHTRGFCSLHDVYFHVYYTKKKCKCDVKDRLEVQDAISFFDKNGFNKCYFPPNFSTWPNHLGSFEDNIYGYSFTAILPKLSLKNGFFDEQSKFSFPNFRLLHNALKRGSTIKSPLTYGHHGLQEAIADTKLDDALSSLHREIPGLET